MRKKIKKAFTLVELLVVIAILAILATVSIVGYNSFTKKAKVSNDTALVSQLNTLLKADSMVNGDAKTPTDALKITSEAGYDVEKLTPTTNDYDIIWNQKTNQFALLDEKGTAVYGEKSTEEYKNWKFVSEYNTATDYSLYLKGTSFIGDLEVKAGIDVGNNTGISSITYANTTNPQNVRIRTNGGSLNVNASKDVVWHYGAVNSVMIKAIENESYHESGTVLGNIEIESGHLAIESTASVSTIIAKPTSTVKVTVTKEENVGTIVTTDTTKTTFNVPESLKTSTNISEDKLKEISNFAGGFGTERSPYLIETTEQFNNIFIKCHAQMKNESYLYFSQVADLVINMNHGSYYFNGNYNGNNHKIVADESLNGVISVFGVSKNNADIENLNVYSSKNAGLFLLAYSFVSTYTDLYVNGSASFNNVNTYVVNNETVDLQGKSSANFGFFTYGAIYYKNGAKQIAVSLNNCNNYASIIANERCAAFIGGYDGLDDARHAKLIMKNCANYGNITATADNAGSIIANTYVNVGWDSMTEESTKEWISLSNVKNYGIIKGKNSAAFANANSNHLLSKTYQNVIGGTYISTDGILKNITTTLYYSENGFNVVNSNDDYSYVAFVVVSAISTNDGFYNSRSMDLDTIGTSQIGTQIKGAHAYDRNTAIENGIINSNTKLDFKYNCTTFKVALIEKDGILYLIFDNKEVSLVDCNVDLFVKAFNVSNEFVGSLEISK